MHRSLSRLSLFLVLIAAALPLAAADDARQQRFGTDVGVLARHALTATADSELTLGDVSVVDLEDGTQRLRFARQLNAAEDHFFFQVDIGNATYTAWRGDSTKVPENIRRHSAERFGNRTRLSVGASSVYDPPPNCGLPSGPQFEPCDNPCSGNSNAVLTSYDGAWNWLADTEGNLNYSRGGVHGCRWFSWMTGHCLPNTNWYTQSCNIVTGSPFIDGGSGTIEGRYYNTSAGNPNLTTNIRHWLRIDYAAPATWVYYEYSFTGEIYTTFHIEFFAWQNGYCFPY